ncbi:hypothetical protein [Petropleomorpha daqingensis]|uniref:Membrane protein YfhO n=1 Tax=Petropleomorpha daqingensis TaxID=2026353 RepID=A0A853CES9_9ACTN|nr:hypothetical protein [Petropleomorpha daqingensis]NYJ04623.1 hypothetical protein [Petropleomorpha daqingensis]
MTVTGSREREEAEAAPPAPAPRRRGTARDTVLALAGYLLAQAVFFVGLRALAPRFFWLDDEQAQYVPAFSWLGRTAVDGRPPLLDPDLGSGGNFVADPQYGVLDPVHWLISWVVGRQDVLLNAAWLDGGAAVLVLGTGTVLLLSVLGVRPALAAAAAVGAASTGLVLWVGGSWWPLLWGTSWLPWLWLGLVLRRWPGAVVTAVAAWQLTASGYPYVLIPAGLLVAGHVLEQHRRRTAGDPSAPGWLQLGGRLAAGAAGLIAGAPGLVGSQEMAAASTRTATDPTPLGNVGALIPNLLDSVLGGSTLTPSVSGAAGGFLWVVPLAATAAFALPSLVLVRWRTALRGPGVLTALVLLVGAFVLTQMPTDVGQLRYPFRYLAVTGPALAALAVLALTAAPLVTRRRVIAALGLVGAQLVLAVVRAPALWGWHALAAVGTVGTLAAVVVLITRSSGPDHRRGPARARWPRWAAAVALLAVVVAADLLPVGSTRTTQARSEQQQGLPLTGLPARQMTQRTDWGNAVGDFRERSAARDTSVTALVFGGFSDVDAPVPDQGWDWGVLQGNANLLAGLRPGFSYVAVGHDRWTQRLCQDLFGQMNSTDECVDGLLARVPGLDISWIDAMSSDEVLLSPYAPDAVVEHFRSTWTEDGLAGVYGRFVRDDGLPGRVTWASPGITAEAVGGDDGAFYSGRPGESERVSTPSGGGRLVFRIPAWPGFRAELDGKPLDVGSVGGTLLSVELPGDLDGARLDLYFDPLADRLIVPAAAAALVVLLLAVAVEVVAGVRFRRRTA